jgi:hypothetical protein
MTQRKTPNLLNSSRRNMFILYCQIINEILWIYGWCCEERDAIAYIKAVIIGWGEGFIM